VRTRKVLSTSALVLILVGLTAAFLADSDGAQPVHRSRVGEPSTLQVFANLLSPSTLPSGGIQRLSIGAVAEFDLNQDGRLSEMETARATAMIRENRKAYDHYGEWLSSLPSWLRRFAGYPEADDLGQEFDRH